MNPSSFLPYQQGTPVVHQARGAADFLRAHDKMAAILPGVNRMAALQKACASALPAMFGTCAVLQLNAGQLVLSTPNSALASKLKQQLPKLQDFLQAQGWQINAIRLKVQVAREDQQKRPTTPPIMPAIAAQAFSALSEALDDSPRNAALREAIAAMIRRQR